MIFKRICAAAMLLTVVSSVGWSDGDIDRVGIKCSTQDFTRTPLKTPCDEYEDSEDPLVSCTSQRSSQATKDKCGARCEYFLFRNQKQWIVKKEAFDGEEDTVWRDLTDEQKQAVKDKCNNETQCYWSERPLGCASRRTGAKMWPDMDSPRQSAAKKGGTSGGRPRSNTR